MAKVDFRHLYKTYNTYYKETQKTSPVTMTEKLSRQEFRAYYNAIKNDRIAQVAKGERKTTGAIIRDMVKGQQNFEMSVSQARQAAKAAKEFRMSSTFKDFRTNKEAGKMLSNLLSNYKKSLMKQGKTNREANLIVSEYFYGS